MDYVVRRNTSNMDYVVTRNTSNMDYVVTRNTSNLTWITWLEETQHELRVRRNASNPT